MKEGKVPGSQNEGQPLLQRKLLARKLRQTSVVHIWGTRKGWVGLSPVQMKQDPWCVLDQLSYGVLDTFKGEDTGIVETNHRGCQLTRSKKREKTGRERW